jgi:hypothetical protein
VDLNHGLILIRDALTMRFISFNLGFLGRLCGLCHICGTCLVCSGALKQSVVSLTRMRWAELLAQGPVDSFQASDTTDVDPSGASSSSRDLSSSAAISVGKVLSGGSFI